jgi:hypothetical protein
MGLSPALVGYAENIWRRFPEAFIALGVPQLEDLFELNEGSWCYRVVDTRAEKVVEIVLPRRKQQDEESPSEGERVPHPSSWLDAPKDVPTSTEMTVSSSSRRAGALRKELAAKVSNLRKSIKDCVSQEIQSQLREARPLNPRARLRNQVPNLLEAQHHFLAQPSGVQELASRSMTGGLCVGSRAAHEEGEGREETISPTESVVSWTSSLAARRGVNICSMDLSVVRNKDSGCVKRAPLLDRSFAPISTADASDRLHQDIDFKKGDKVRVTKESRARGRLAVVLEPRWYGLVQVELEDDGYKGQVKTFLPAELELVEATDAESATLELSEASSPGSELQRAARRRRGANTHGRGEGQRATESQG